MVNLSVMKNMMEPGKKSRIGDQGTSNVFANDAHDVTALYERLSVDDEQEGESNSITNQKVFLENYAKEHGFGAYIRHYTDDGYSGKDFVRPGWQQLIADIEAGIVKTVLVKDMSRVGRNHIETGYYTEIYFAQMGIRFIAINNGIDNINPDSTEFAGIMNIMNEWYVRDQSRKVGNSMRQKGKSGLPLTSVPPFGYLRDPNQKNHWIVDPVMAPVVKEMFELAASGLCPSEIAIRFREQRYETPGYYLDRIGVRKYLAHSKERDPYNWTPGTVKNALMRAEYKGCTVNFRTHRADYRDRVRPNPSDEWAVFEDTHEAIVDADTWEKAQAVVNRYGAVIDYGPLDPLAHSVYCARCGARMYNQRGMHKEKYNGKSYPYNIFQCPTYSKSVYKDRRMCESNTISMEPLVTLVQDTIRAISNYAIHDEAAFRMKLEQMAKAHKPEKVRALKKNINQAERRIAELDRVIAKLYENFALGKIPDARFEELSAQYEREQAELISCLAQYRGDFEAASDDDSRVEQFLAIARKYRNCDAVTQEVVDAFIDRIVVHHRSYDENGESTRGIEIHLKFIGDFPIPPETFIIDEARIKEEELKKQRRLSNRKKKAEAAAKQNE